MEPEVLKIEILEGKVTQIQVDPSLWFVDLDPLRTAHQTVPLGAADENQSESG